MAKEILAIPEENLLEVIKVIRVGLSTLGGEVSEEVRQNLELWCNEEEAYSRQSGEWAETEPGIYRTTFIVPDKLGPSVFLPPPLPGAQIDPGAESA